MSCPECGRDDSWNDLGCMRCGLEFFPPSEAYWAASTLTIAERVAGLRENWGPESPEPVLSPQERRAEYEAWLAARYPKPGPPPGTPLPASASYIEKRFWEARIRLGRPELDALVPQHKAGPYRMDFALPALMIGIELDGLRNHSSTEDIARDCLRQRWLQWLGWRIIRFGGREVHRDADYVARQVADFAQKWAAS